MKSLILAEKPSVGKDIARVLKARPQKSGAMENDKYVVSWAMGHLVTLADPEKYDNKYKNWDLNDLPIIPNDLKLVVIKQTARQFNLVKSIINRKDVNEIIIATDAGREGELVARWILQMSGNKKPIKRLWISSVTDKAIKEGFSKLKDGKNYNNLFYSAQARADADWLVGINATRALTTKHNASLSCGRVQTPTLAMINKREEEIRQFVSKPYYGLEAICERIKLSWEKGSDFNKDKVDDILRELTSKTAEIVSVEKAKKKTYPPKLYDLTQLQREANKRYGFSAKETLSIMQQLYERHKVLTYPRTDSRYLTDDIVPTIGERLSALPREYSTMRIQIMKKPVKANSNFVDNKKVSDHHAIIPTEQQADVRDFTDKERKIYDMVVRRFLAVLYPCFEYEQTTIKASINSHIFIAKGKTVLIKGFKEVYDYEENDDNEETLKEQELPKISKGDKLNINKVNLTTGHTKPPARFNEATLLSAMENPAKYMESNDKQLAKTLGQTGGLGTVATRADIIEKLFSSFLLEKKGKEILITSKGKQLLNLAPKELKSPEMTARWEQNLSKIAEGTMNKKEFMTEIKSYTKEVVKEIKTSEEKFRHDNLSNVKCPDCGKFLLNVNGKKGKMLICQDRDCGYRRSVSLSINSRCPQCHKKLELVGEGDSKRVVCVCGHNERYSVFQERKNKESNKMNKKEVQQYIKDLNKDSEPNNPFKDLLKDFK